MSESEAESRSGGSLTPKEGAEAPSATDSPGMFHGAPTIDLPTADGAGLRIGPYRILQLLGEGGFGSVFMAEQSGGA